jgi:hypothetical protein
MFGCSGRVAAEPDRCGGRQICGVHRRGQDTQVDSHFYILSSPWLKKMVAVWLIQMCIQHAFQKGSLDAYMCHNLSYIKILTPHRLQC